MSPRKNDPLIGWVTITYRSVLGAILAVVALIAIVLYFMYPEQAKKMLGAAADKIAAQLGGGDHSKQALGAGAQQAKFTAIDGTVRVKKASSNTWVDARQDTVLEKDDVVQTGAEGLAQIVFADGSIYVVKPDSLISIQENSMNQQQQTNVAVEVKTGTVDLSTATYTQGSRSQVTVAGAKANLAADTSAQVRNDPRGDSAGFLVKKGGAEVTRNGETVRVTDYERLTFSADAAHMTKTKEIAPPVLITPANMAPIFTGGQPKALEFTWSPVQTARLYRLRVSKNPYFSSTVFDKRAPTPNMSVPGLTDGAYYWLVQSVDDNGRESIESERNRFTIIAKAPEKPTIALDLQPFVQHGRILEIKGKTEPGARVMANGQDVTVEPDGAFTFFTKQLPSGENLVTITALNTKGGSQTITKKVQID